MPPVRLTDRSTNKRGATVAPKGTVFSADNHANGDRFIKPQSVPRDFQGPRAEITELREQLLDELNHRLKNNLQILYGFLQIAQQKTNNAEAREVLSDTSRRIGAMGAAQQVFYSVRNSTDISGQSFIEAVCANARAFFRHDLSIDCEARAGPLPQNTAPTNAVGSPSTWACANVRERSYSACKTKDRVSTLRTQNSGHRALA